MAQPQINLSTVNSEFNTANTGVIYMSNFYTNSPLKLTTGQPAPFVASGNQMNLSLFTNKKYCYFSIAYESSSSIVRTLLSPQIFVNLNGRIKKNGKIGIITCYFQQTSWPVLFNLFINNVNVFQQWNGSTTYGLWTMNLTANNISITTTSTILLQFTTLATGRTFYMGCHSNTSNIYLTMTVV